jgi:hypothetical protein
VVLNRLLYGYTVSRAIQVVAQLGVADALKDETKGAAELAAAVGAESGALHRVLRALASVGLFTEVEPGRFALTPVGTQLRADVPGSLRALACLYGTEVMLRSFDGLLESVRSGQPACEAAFGKPLFPYLAEHPQEAATFNAAMAAVTASDTASILAACDFSGLGTLVDVGGGQGSLLLAILEVNPGLRGVLFDQPSVVEAARERIRSAGLDERCELVGGDFFEAVPAGADAYLVKNVLWDWDDDRAVEILRNCRRAMPAQARLLALEALIPPGDQYSFNKLVDLNLLVLGGGGRGRSQAQVESLFEAAELEIARVIPTRGRLTVVEGRLNAV